MRSEPEAVARGLSLEATNLIASGSTRRQGHKTSVRVADEFDTFGVGDRLKIIYVGFHPTLLNLSPSAKKHDDHSKQPGLLSLPV